MMRVGRTMFGFFQNLYLSQRVLPSDPVLSFVCETCSTAHCLAVRLLGRQSLRSVMLPHRDIGER